MLGRAVITKGDPARMDEGVAFVMERVQPVVDSLPGSHGLGMWVNRETGDCVVNTVWVDEAALIASDEQLSGLRAEAMAKLGASEARIEILEPVVVFQTRPNEAGDWTRSSEIRLPLDRLGDNLAAFSSEILPQVRQIPGVTTIGLLVNRGTGLTVLSVSYDSRESFEASREFAQRMRARSMQQYGAELLRVMEMQVAVVGIRPPVDLPAQGGTVEFPVNAKR